MSRTMKLGLALLLAVQASTVFAVTGMKYVSTPGDYIGGGVTRTYLPPTATVSATGAPNAAHVVVSAPGETWFIDFASAVAATLEPGSYPDATRYPFNSPLGPGLSMFGDGRGCNTSNGWFQVREYAVDGSGVVSKLAIDFVQNCEMTGPPLYGSVRINSDLPLVVPELAAIAGPDFDVLGGAAAKLDATQSFARKFSPLAYRWTQVGGPAVVLDDPSSPTPSFIAPAITKKHALMRFRLKVTESTGRSSEDDTIVLVENASAPRTQISFHGDPGDYITLGQSWSYDTHDATIAFSRNFDAGVSASIDGATFWNFDSATPAGTPFVPGTYLNAQRFPFQDAKSPGLSLYGDGRGCNTLTGKFVVYQAVFDSLGNPQTVDITFEQHCEGGAPAAYGEVLLNAVPHDTLAADWRAALLEERGHN